MYFNEAINKELCIGKLKEKNIFLYKFLYR